MKIAFHVRFHWNKLNMGYFEYAKEFCIWKKRKIHVIDYAAELDGVGTKTCTKMAPLSGLSTHWHFVAFREGSGYSHNSVEGKGVWNWFCVLCLEPDLIHLLWRVLLLLRWAKARNAVLKRLVAGANLSHVDLRSSCNKPRQITAGRSISSFPRASAPIPAHSNPFQTKNYYKTHKMSPGCCGRICVMTVRP